MNCRKCLKLVEDYIDARIECATRVSIEAHLTSCDACRERFEQTGRLLLSLQELGNNSASVDVWPGVRERIAALDPSGRAARPRPRFRLISVPTLAVTVAALVITFLATEFGSRGPQPGLQRPDAEYLQYVQAYSQFQSNQSLDAGPMKVVVELSREKVWRGE